MKENFVKISRNLNFSKTIVIFHIWTPVVLSSCCYKLQELLISIAYPENHWHVRNCAILTRPSTLGSHIDTFALHTFVGGRRDLFIYLCNLNVYGAMAISLCSNFAGMTEATLALTNQHERAPVTLTATLYYHATISK